MIQLTHPPIELFSLEDVRLAKPKLCFYSVKTVWWTHDPNDLYKGPPPRDWFGCPLWENDKVAMFWDAARIKAHPQYGTYPITCWMAAHSKNIEKIINQNEERFEGKLNDVTGWEVFSKRIEELVNAGRIIKLDG